MYAYHRDPMPLEQVIREVTPLVSGGTLSVFLGVHALQRGYEAILYTYNLDIFDPSWFEEDESRLAVHLAAQAEVKDDKRLQVATGAYVDFLRLGGRIRFQELRPDLIRRHLIASEPILTGLSATYLYGCAREVEHGGRLEYDSVRGKPTGHFVVVHGYEADTDSALVADPLHENRFGARNYRVGVMRLLGAVMLGVLTYDGNLLVVRPAKEHK